ncbi:hypothetical protein [Clostridium sp.]|jgi:hypothetical protein|uniref:hypothetical protein n=1 Tax=Clostridium sp. TaxID=1506 RepID=UPI003EEA4783
MQKEKGKLNSGLKNYNEERKYKTQSKVEESILTLIEERSVVNIIKLMEMTELSRPTFNKTHVEEILRKYKVCKYKDVKVITNDNPKSYLKNLENEYRKNLNDNEKLIMELAKTREANSKLELELGDKQERIGRLLGMIDELQRKVNNISQSMDVYT